METPAVRERTESPKTPSGEGVAAGGSDICQVQKKGWFKGILPMAICCGAPLVFLAAISLFGASLAASASGLLSLVAVLACPLGMYLMMRMMMNKK
jgi:hypothetical protein